MTDYAWVMLAGWTLVSVGVLCVLAWFARRSRKGSRLCPTCDYDLSVTPGLTCPECGMTARNERALQRRRRKRLWGRLGLALVLIGAGMLVFNPGRREGWASSLPDRMIWPLMPLVDAYADGWINAYHAERMALPVTMMTPENTLPRRWERLLVARRFVRRVRDAAAAMPSDLPQSAAERVRATQMTQGLAWVMKEDPGVAPAYIASDLLDIAGATEDPSVRAAILKQLPEGGVLDARCVGRLRTMLNSTDATAWRVAFPLLRRSVGDARLLTPEILRGLELVPAEGRADFLRELYDMVPLDAEALKKIAAMRSNDPDQMVRARAGAVIWRNEALTNPR